MLSPPSEQEEEDDQSIIAALRQVHELLERPSLGETQYGEDFRLELLNALLDSCGPLRHQLIAVVLARHKAAFKCCTACRFDLGKFVCLLQQEDLLCLPQEDRRAAWTLFSPETKARWRGQMRDELLETRYAETATATAVQKMEREDDEAGASALSRLEALRGRCEKLEGFLAKQNKSLLDMSVQTNRPSVMKPP